MSFDYTYLRTGETVEVEGRNYVIPAKSEGWSELREKLGWKHIKVGFCPHNFPVLTTDKVPSELHPIWLVSADSEWNMDLHNALKSLADNLRKAAPAGTIALYNLKYKWTDYHGHKYLQGTADAYGKEPQCL